MRRLAFVTETEVAAAIGPTAELVRSGGVVLLPTETFYGLGADPVSEAAVERVATMKGRPPTMALPVLCADWAQVERLAVVPEAFRVRLARSWPAPLTVVLAARRKLPAGAGGETIAVRVPGHAALRALLYRVGPLTGTSANVHRGSPPTSIDEALASLCGQPDLALDAGAAPGGLPSTLVDLSSGEPKVVREGAFDWLAYRVHQASRERS